MDKDGNPLRGPDGEPIVPGPLPKTVAGVVRGRVTMTPQAGVTTIRTVNFETPAQGASLTVTDLKIVSIRDVEWSDTIDLQIVAMLAPATKTITVEQADVATRSITRGEGEQAVEVRTFQLQGKGLKIQDYDSDEQILIYLGTADINGDLERIQIVSAVLAPQEPNYVLEYLKKISPIFGKTGRIEGKVLLDARTINWPVAARRQATEAAGNGTLKFEDFRVTPEGLLAKLLKLGGPSVAERMPAVIDPVTFTIANGNVHCDNFTIRFGEDFDLRFSGDVGLDETLDLKMSLPVSAKLLAKYGVKGSVLEYFSAVSGERLIVPIRGTTSKPAFSVTLADLQPLIQRGLKKMLVDNLLKGGDSKGPVPPTPEGAADAKTPETKTPEKTPEEKARDLLQDFLKRQFEKDPKKNEP